MALSAEIYSCHYGGMSTTQDLWKGTRNGIAGAPVTIQPKKNQLTFLANMIALKKQELK